MEIQVSQHWLDEKIEIGFSETRNQEDNLLFLYLVIEHLMFDLALGPMTDFLS